LSIDYVGEFTTTWLGIGEGTTLNRLESRGYPHSLGIFYSAMTDYLGFLRASDEYKVMGLASYGEPEYLDDFRRILRVHPDGWYDLDLSWFCCHYRPGPRSGYFSERFLRRFGPPRRKGEPIEARHRNLAASAQRVLEEAALDKYVFQRDAYLRNLLESLLPALADAGVELIEQPLPRGSDAALAAINANPAFPVLIPDPATGLSTVTVTCWCTNTQAMIDGRWGFKRIPTALLNEWNISQESREAWFAAFQPELAVDPALSV
jgi:hypothetical protein